MNDVLSHALDLAERGYHLFPLVSGGKTPALTGNWQDAATQDRRILERWFARTNCNIAIACEPSGIFAVDLDTAKPGADGPAHGIETLRELANGRDLPRTLTVATPSGGTHLYFCQPTEGPALRNTARRLGPLIDTRGIGGYLVAPGSRIDGVGYRITDDVPLADVPAWITGLLRPPEPIRDGLRPDHPIPTGLGSPYARAALGREAARVSSAVPGQRNDTLNRAAYSLGRLVADGLLDRAQVESQLTLAARSAGLGRAEIEATLSSGLTAGLERRGSHVIAASSAPASLPQAAPAETTSTAPTPETLAALHAAFDALERELDQPSASSEGSQAAAYLTAEAAAEALDDAVSRVRNTESRARALENTPEWHRIRTIGRAAADFVREVRRAARDYAEDLKTDVYIDGAVRTIGARACRQLAELAAVAADRLARRGLVESPTYRDLQAVRRGAEHAEAALTGRVTTERAEQTQRAATRNELKQLRRDLRLRARACDAAPGTREAVGPRPRQPR